MRSKWNEWELSTLNLSVAQPREAVGEAQEIPKELDRLLANAMLPNEDFTDEEIQEMQDRMFDAGVGYGS